MNAGHDGRDGTWRTLGPDPEAPQFEPPLPALRPEVGDRFVCTPTARFGPTVAAESWTHPGRSPSSHVGWTPGVSCDARRRARACQARVPTASRYAIAKRAASGAPRSDPSQNPSSASSSSSSAAAAAAPATRRRGRRSDEVSSRVGGLRRARPGIGRCTAPKTRPVSNPQGSSGTSPRRRRARR